MPYLKRARKKIIFTTFNPFKGTNQQKIDFQPLKFKNLPKGEILHNIYGSPLS